MVALSETDPTQFQKMENGVKCSFTSPQAKKFFFQRGRICNLDKRSVDPDGFG